MGAGRTEPASGHATARSPSSALGKYTELVTSLVWGRTLTSNGDTPTCTEHTCAVKFIFEANAV